MEDEDVAQIDDELTAEEEELLAVRDRPEQERIQGEAANAAAEAPDGLPEDSAYFTDPELDDAGNEVDG